MQVDLNHTSVWLIWSRIDILSASGYPNSADSRLEELGNSDCARFGEHPMRQADPCQALSTMLNPESSPNE